MTVKRRKYGRGFGYHVDGVKTPGVTKILDMLPNDNLVGWAGRVTAEYALDHWDALGELLPSERLKKLTGARYEIVDPAARRGTQVHKLGEALVTGAEVAVPDELAGHVEAYRDWLDRIEPVPVATELVVANRTERYCGTGDLVADLPALEWVGGEVIPPARWLLDLKTTASGVWPSSALQLCAYEHAETFVDPDAPDDERLMSWLEIEHCGVVWIKSDACELRPVDTGPEVWEFFKHLRWLHDRQDDMPGWIGSSATAALVAATT